LSAILRAFITVYLGTATLAEPLVSRRHLRGTVKKDPGNEVMTTKTDAVGASQTTDATILVVEDEPIVRMLVVDQLGDLGFHTAEAQDASEALALLGRGDRFDLMLTDVGLPGMNGRELAEAARGLQPDLKVLFATGYSGGHEGELGLPAIGMGLVGKPFEMDELARRIRSLLEG
jgi:CheY-like chemotaxis protein